MTDRHGSLLLTFVRGAAARLTVSRSFGTGARAGAAVMAVVALLAVASVIVPVAGVPLVLAVVAAAVAVLVAGTIAALLRPVPLIEAARALDLSLRLEERISTAVEVTTAGVRGSSLAPRVVRDAERALSMEGIAEATPLRAPRTLWWIPLLAAALFAWTTWLHGLTIPGTPAHRSSEVIKKEGQRLEQFARSLQSRTRTDHMPATRRLTPQIRDLGVRLQRERLDRAEALAKVAELAQQLEQTRREINERLQADRPSPAREGGIPPDLRRQSAQRQIRQLQELLSRLRQDPSTASRDALDRLGQIASSGEGTDPTRVQQSLQQAREQLQRGNLAGAGDAINEALRELEGLDSLLADSEGVTSAEQQLARTRATLAGGPVEDEPEAGRERAQTAQPPSGPGQNRPVPEQGADATAPPQGPNEGSTAGTGKGGDTLGAATSRLQATKTPQRIRGAQAEGPAATSEVVGAGRPGTSRAPVAAVSPAVVASADQAMARSRTPARYRDIVRRYFQRLARLR